MHGFPRNWENPQTMHGFPRKIWENPQKMHGFPTKTWPLEKPVKIHRKLHGFPRKTWENPAEMHGFPRKHWKIQRKCMDSLRKLKEDPDGLPRKNSRIRRKLVRPLKFYGNSQRIHGCLLPRDLGGTIANPPTCTNTWWKFQQIIKCKKYMLATCQIFFRINNVFFSSRLVRWKIGLVFSAYGGNSVWSFLLTVETLSGNWTWCFLFMVISFPRPEIGFGLFCLRFPHRE